MGILNVTPDSFYDGGKYTDLQAITEQVGRMLEEGADILDIGGYSSRPGADDIPVEQEVARILPVLEMVAKQFPQAVVSVDTFRAQVAKEAVAAGAHIINDISGGSLDPAMFEMVSDLKVPYILMHMKGTPQNMKALATYNDILLELTEYFQNKIYRLEQLGVHDIVIDLGFGFAKNIQQNYFLLNKLPEFRLLGKPLLVGISRKSMIYKTLGITAAESLNGTTALNTVALLNGAHILRVHDVKPAKEAVKLVQALRNSHDKQ